MTEFAEDPRPALELYYAARLSNERGDLATAEAEYRRSLELEDHWKTHQQLGRVLAELGRHDEAHASFERGYHGKPRNDRVATDYAISLLRRGDPVEAKRVLNEVLDRNASFSPARAELERLK